MPRRTTPRLIAFHRDHILQTAEALFAEKGMKETTVDDIARAADCSKSTIYVYFQNKEEIQLHIIHRYMCQLSALIGRCAEANDRFEACYDQLCWALDAVYEENPLYFESTLGHICVEETARAELEILQRVYEIGEAINDQLLALFARGIQEDFLRRDLEILPTVFTLWASLANTIQIAHQKEAYIAARMHMDRAAFLQYSFQLLLSSIQRR